MPGGRGTRSVSQIHEVASRTLVELRERQMVKERSLRKGDAPSAVDGRIENPELQTARVGAPRGKTRRLKNVGRFGPDRSRLGAAVLICCHGLSEVEVNAKKI
jgi:hypothetical protein